MVCSVFGFSNTSMNNYTDRIRSNTLSLALSPSLVFFSLVWLFDVRAKRGTYSACTTTINRGNDIHMSVADRICVRGCECVCVYFPRHRQIAARTSISDDSLTWTLTNGFENILFNFLKCRWLNANLSLQIDGNFVDVSRKFSPFSTLWLPLCHSGRSACLCTSCMYLCVQCAHIK